MLRRLLAVLVLLVATSVAAAAIVLHADVAALTGKSRLIVRGEVRERTVELDYESGQIWTKYQLDVADTLVGAKHESVDIHVMGGRTATRDQTVKGVAKLETGAEYVLFLWRDDGGRFQVLGEGQGAFRVTRGPGEGVEPGSSAERARCTNQVQGLVLLDAEGRRKEAAPITRSLVELEREVRAAAEAAQLIPLDREDARLELLRRRARAEAERLRGRPGHDAEPDETSETETDGGDSGDTPAPDDDARKQRAR